MTSVLEAIGATFTFAVGIMVSPLPIIALIIVLMGKKAVSGGFTFVVGWILSVMALIYIAIALGQQFQNTQPNRLEGLIQVALGVFFVYYAFKQFAISYRTRKNPTLPKWMEGITSLSLLKLFGLAVLLNLSNVKNIPLAAQAVNAVRTIQLSVPEQWITAFIFALITSLPMLVPAVWVAFGGERAQSTMSHAKNFLVKYNHLVMGGLFLMMGSQAVGGGLQVLARVAA